MKDFPKILSIAGSDPSGGAGIQADLKTISALGGYAAAAITAVTAQNTTGVYDVKYVSARLVASQVDLVMRDIRPDALKIGMTGAVPVIRAIAKVLRRHVPENVVFDPVMVSTSRHALTRPEAVEVMASELFPLCCLATPNLDETACLVGYKIDSLDKMKQAAEELYREFGCAFLVKGGDMEQADEAVDVLFCREGLHLFRAPHIRTENLHGTGCTLSSAIATNLGWGLPMTEAVEQAKQFVNRAIEAAAPLHIGEGHGPLWHFWNR